MTAAGRDGWSRAEKSALALVLALSVAFRLLPIEYGKPGEGFFSSDEVDAVSRAAKMLQGDLLPLHANKPTFYNGIIGLTYAGYYALLKLGGETAAEFQRRFVVEPFPFYRLARAVSIAASVATLALLLWSLRKRTAIAVITGAAILGLARSSVYYGHVAKEDALAALWSFAAFAFAVEHLERGRGRNRYLILSALAAGFAVSTKYNCLLVILFPVIPAVQLRNFKMLLLCSLVMAAGFVAGTPYALIHPLDFMWETLGSTIVSEVGGSFSRLEYLGRSGPVVLLEILWRELGPAIIIAAAATFILARRQPGACLAWAFLASYLLMLLLARHLDYQYVLPLTPILAWCTGVGIDRIRVSMQGVAGAVAGAMVLYHGFLLSRQTSEFLGGDTRLTAAKWIQTRGAPGKPILVLSGFYNRYYPPLDWSQETFVRLEEESRSEGGDGGYFRAAAPYAKAREGYNAYFLHLRTGVTQTPQGPKLEEQSEHLDQNMGNRYSLIVIPQQTLRILETREGVYAPLRFFLQSILDKYPVVADIRPRPWLEAGPSLLILNATSKRTSERATGR